MHAATLRHAILTHCEKVLCWRYLCEALQDAKKLQRSGQSLGVGYRSPLRQVSDVRAMQKTGLSRGASEASTSQWAPALRYKHHSSSGPMHCSGLLDRPLTSFDRCARAVNSTPEGLLARVKRM